MVCLVLQKWLDPAQDHKAKWLYIWAKEAGLVASRDEVAEMLATNSLPPPLAQLWKEKTAEQKAIEQLCQAATVGDLDALKVTLAQEIKLEKQIPKTSVCLSLEILAASFFENMPAFTNLCPTGNAEVSKAFCKT